MTILGAKDTFTRTTTPMQRSRSGRSGSFIAICLAGLLVAMTLVGIVRAYSPVPFWDMWDGYVGFYLRARQYGWTAWIEPHNEHRIILSRLFFYVDIALFNARGIVPLAANVLIAAGIALVFCRAVTRTVGDMTLPARSAICALIVGAVFFWDQRENFTWAFQTQFFLATWLPLLALYLAARAAERESSNFFTIGSITCAVLALGSMANGILVLPLVLVFGICVSMQQRRMMAIAATTTLVALLSIYASLASPPSTQTGPSLISVLLGRPIDVLHYVLRYLGSPLWFAFQRSRWTQGLVEVGGGFLLLASLCILPGAWRDRHTTPLRLAMLAMVAYVVASSLGTALGRLSLPYGLEGAWVSRYTTVAGAGWIACMVAGLPVLRTVRIGTGLPWACSLVLLCMMPWQIRATRSQAGLVYSRDVGALALAVHVNDPAGISAVYPGERASSALDTATWARASGLLPFGRQGIGKAVEWLGVHVQNPVCDSRIDTATPLGVNARDVRVDGHVKRSFSNEAGRPSLVIDDRDIIVGWALVRDRSAHIRGDINPGNAFTAYVRDPRVADTAWIFNGLRICQTPTEAPFAYSE